MDVRFNIDSREQIGNIHWQKQFEREYKFPVEVYRKVADGTRELVRVEAA